MEQDKFWEVQRSYFITSEGKVDLPMFFYQVRVRHLNFFVDYDRVLPLLKGTGLVPCKFFNGKAVVSLIFYNYQKVSIPSYDEVTITIVVRPEMLADPKIYLTNFLKQKGANWTVGAYVLEMPVTRPEARAAGREIWGYPKFETKIPYKLEENYFEFAVLDPETEEQIVSVKGKTRIGIKMRAFDLVTYSNYSDSIWKTIIDVNAWYKNCFRRTAEVKVGPSKHGMAENIRQLGLDRLKPFAIQVTDKFRSKLNPGRAIAEFKSPALPYPPKSKKPGAK